MMLKDSLYTFNYKYTLFVVYPNIPTFQNIHNYTIIYNMISHYIVVVKVNTKFWNCQFSNLQHVYLQLLSVFY